MTDSMLLLRYDHVFDPEIVADAYKKWPTPCEDMLNWVLDQDPHGFAVWMYYGRLPDTLLIFGAEMLGRISYLPVEHAVRMEAIEALTKLAQHPKAYVREGAVHGLGYFTMFKEAKELLRNLAEHDPDPEVKVAAIEALDTR